MFDADFIKRFEAKFIKEDGCWLWQASCAGKGYGQIKLPRERKQEYVHRVAYLIYKGSIAEGLQVMHSCDNPKCVNPDHLSLGTCSDNLHGMSVKGRSTRGSRNAQAKLREEDIAVIKTLLKTGMIQSEIAKKFSVSQVEISRIKCGLRWARVK